MISKLVYVDGKIHKVLRGNVSHEDDIFIGFLTVDNNIFRINKRNIISIKHEGANGGDWFNSILGKVEIELNWIKRGGES